MPAENLSQAPAWKSNYVDTKVVLGLSTFRTAATDDVWIEVNLIVFNESTHRHARSNRRWQGRRSLRENNLIICPNFPSSLAHQGPPQYRVPDKGQSPRMASLECSLIKKNPRRFPARGSIFD
jgi:hypothetical protein